MSEPTKPTHDELKAIYADMKQIAEEESNSNADGAGAGAASTDASTDGAGAASTDGAGAASTDGEGAASTDAAAEDPAAKEAQIAALNEEIAALESADPKDEEAIAAKKAELEALQPAATAGGRRRSKRRHPKKGSRKSKKSGKKGSARKSKKGGRSRKVVSKRHKHSNKKH